MEESRKGVSSINAVVKEKDWIGDENSVFKMLGASNHTNEDREQDDFYATEPKAIDILCEVEQFEGKIWECACGQGHLSERLKLHGYDVISSDLIDRGYGTGNIDFLQCNKSFDGNIITNPPYKYAKEFIEKALELIPNRKKLAMFLKLQFLEGKARKDMFVRHPPRIVYVSSSRLLCAKNAIFHINGSAVAYCWYIWEKGYHGKTNIKWVN